MYSCLLIVASRQWHELLSKKVTPVNVLRWYNFIKSQEAASKVLSSLPDDAKANLIPPVSSRLSVEKSVGVRNQEGKFVDLPHAEMGKVVVRFPPEASGYVYLIDI